MSLGLCCQWLTEKNGKHKNILVSRSLQKGRFENGLYTDDHIRSVYSDNLTNLRDVLRDKVIPAGIRVFRMSSSMFPLFDLVSDREYYDNETTATLFEEIGKLVIDNGVRLTTHPGQFVVLSSDSDEVCARSAREMEFHGWVFDQMNLPRTPYYAINVHGGKKGASAKLIETINNLDEATKSRMTLENCEYSWSVSDLIGINKHTDVPIVFDSHHFQFNNDNITGANAMELASITWPAGIRPLTHLSNAKPEFRDSGKPHLMRRHSDFIYEIPDYQLQANNDGEIDIDIEAKKKNLAVLRATDELNLRLA